MERNESKTKVLALPTGEERKKRADARFEEYLRMRAVAQGFTLLCGEEEDERVAPWIALEYKYVLRRETYALVDPTHFPWPEPGLRLEAEDVCAALGISETDPAYLKWLSESKEDEA